MNRNRCYPDLTEEALLEKFWLETFVPPIQAEDEWVDNQQSTAEYKAILTYNASWFRDTHVPPRLIGKFTVDHLVNSYIRK